MLHLEQERETTKRAKCPSIFCNNNLCWMPTGNRQKNKMQVRSTAMKNKFIKTLFSTALVLGLTTTAQAEETFIPENQVPIITVFEPLVAGENLSKMLVDSPEISSDLGRAPAPPLTAVQIYAVGSSDCNWEYLPVGATTTSCDHGGSQLRVAVLETGYGSNRIAWLNGGLLPSSALYATEGICNVGGVPTMPCPIGYSISSWMLYYNLDGNQAGQFKFQSTSSNWPTNTYSQQIWIK